MSAAETLRQIAAIRIVPVIVIDDAHRAPELASALAAGGIPCAEITLRTPDGLSALAAIDSVPGFITGAGTVITPEQVDRCVAAGAQFIVSPGLDEEVVERALHHDVAVLPGIATATELQRARRVGVEVVKFFPADVLGGLPAITALAGPFPDARFVPSGGVTAANALDYLRHPAVTAISGSWMASRRTIARGEFDLIHQAAQRAAELVASLA